MSKFTRKKFLQTSITGAVGLSMLPIMKSCTPGVNDTIRMGVIGLGRQAVFLINGFNEIPGVKIVAGADVYGVKRQRFEMMVRENQQEQQQTVEVDTYEDYQQILDRQDIDAVVISSPDHWHAFQAIDAARAGKDIYLEKPLTFTIEDGNRVVEEVRQHNIILGVGSQQRSDPNFQHAVRLAREGRLGAIDRINAWVGPPPTPYDLPEERLPIDLNWEKWLGPNPYVHYNHELNPPISIDPWKEETFWGGWRWYKETGGGFMTDWGAHNFDIAQWALGKDDSGPVEIFPAGHEGHEHITFRYDDGVSVINGPFTEEEGYGVKIWGEDAWFVVKRGRVEASDDSLLPEDAGQNDDDVPYETATPHLLDFVEAVRERRDPIVPVEVGHRSNSVGILGNIATFLDRPVRWDPVNQRFVDDPEAGAYIQREYRDGYRLA